MRSVRKCESVRRTQTEHVVYCLRDQQHDGPCAFADGNGMHFWLDGYEITNLRAMLGAIDAAPAGSPLAVFKNGDWFHQVKSKLSSGFVLPHIRLNIRAAAFGPEIGVRMNETHRAAIANACRQAEDLAHKALAGWRER